MRAGGGGVQDRRQHWRDAAGFDHTAPRVLTRGWALTRLIVLVVACGIGAAVTLAIGIAILVALVGDI
jgi:hypothetical protein